MPILTTLGAACARAWGFTSGLLKDPYFNLTTLLLPGNGTDGKQNRTFLDSSGQNGGAGWTITPNGNATQGTFSPFSQTGWGNYFNGSSYLSSTSNAAFGMGSGDYTIECWLYITTTSTYDAIYSTTGTTSSDIQVQLNNRLLRVSSYTAQTVIANAGTEVSLNTWTHVAFCRSGTTLKLFKNGVEVGSGTDSTTWATGAIDIGRVFGSQLLTGYMSNLRVVKGTALYTSGFTPSTTPLTAISGTSLLTCQSNRFRDASGNGFTITTSGSPSVTPFSPFAPTQSYSAAAVGGSGYFDGTGDYLTAADNAAFTLGTSDFTIEAWVYALSSGTTDRYFIAHADNATAAGSSFALYIFSGNSKIYFECYVSATTTIITSDSAIVLNQWNHVAICRSSGTLAMLVNGTRQASPASIGSSSINNCANSLSVGARTTAGSTYTGYLSSSRMVVGTDVYGAGNSTITVPTAPLTAITNTQLLLNFTNAGVVDATAKNVLETVGTAQISNGAAKFGTTSIYLNGDGNYLTSRGSPVFSLNGDFTMEAWVYPINAGRSADAEKYGTIVSCSAPGVNSPEFSWFVRIVGSSITEYFLNINGTTVLQVTGLSVSLNAWHYFAVTRSGTGTGNLKLYIDGTLVGTSSGAVTQSATFTSAQTLMVGRNAGSTAYQNWLSGYFQDVRITPGYARNVTIIPTAPFPKQ